MNWLIGCLFFTFKEENLELFVRILTMNKFKKKTGQYYNLERLIDDIYSSDICTVPSIRRDEIQEGSGNVFGVRTSH